MPCFVSAWVSIYESDDYKLAAILLVATLLLITPKMYPKKILLLGNKFYNAMIYETC